MKKWEYKSHKSGCDSRREGRKDKSWNTKWTEENAEHEEDILDSLKPDPSQMRGVDATHRGGDSSTTI